MQPIGSLGRLCVAGTAMYAVLLGLLEVWWVLTEEAYAEIARTGQTSNPLTALGETLSYVLSGHETTLIFGVVGIAFVILATNAVWLYRASANAAIMHPSSERITPGWSLAWYIIPIANLFMPFRSMREIWNSSTQPESDLKTPVPGWMWVWWLAWTLGSIVDQFLEDFYHLSLSLISLILLIISSVLFIRIIRAVSHAQDNWTPGSVFE